MGKKSDAKHADAWSPEICWQILRRTPLYKDMVNLFLAWLNESDGITALNARLLFDEVSKEQSTNVSHLSEERKRHFRLNAKTTIETYQDHTGLKEFLNNYGDILRFPIHYDTNKPNVFYLNSLWRFRPAVVVDSSYLEEVKREESKSTLPLSSVYHSFEINPAFSDAVIEEAITKSLAELMQNLRQRRAASLESIKVRWDEVQEGPRAIEIRESNPEITNFPLARSVLSAYEYRNLTDRQRYDRLRSRLDTINRLMDFFGKTRSQRSSELLKA